jgi:putative transposase
MSSISDAGWSAFLSILAAKAAYAGRRVVAVPPAYTSQTCSGCGRVVWKGLSVRWHQCPYEDCGTHLHRDHNAARNREPSGRAVGQSRRAEPSGRRGGSRVGEPRIPRLQPWGVSIN